jgi:hypothetical protein
MGASSASPVRGDGKRRAVDMSGSECLAAGRSPSHRTRANLARSRTVRSEGSLSQHGAASCRITQTGRTSCEEDLINA